MSETEWESDPSFNCEPSKHSNEDIRVAIQAYQLCRSKLKILDTLPIFYVYILWLADAYIAQLDEQEALNVPYDREWLEARPEFERIGNRLIACTRINPVKIVWYLIANSSEHWCLQWCGHYIEIPAPATKADVIKLLEVFT